MTLRPCLLVATLAALGAACGQPPTPMDATAVDAVDAVNAADAVDAGALDATPPGEDVALARPDVYDPFHDPDARSPTTAIATPLDTWTWVPFPDAVCANGGATGIGVNRSTRSNDVLVFLMGGGACWNDATCFIVRTAANFDTGYDAAAFARDGAMVGRVDFFDRADARNPWRDASFVFVPYCTGDVHSGNRVTTLRNNGRNVPVYFTGFRNVGVYLRRLVPTFPDARRVWLTGSSAGGFGAAINWEQTQNAFGAGVRVDVVDDSGQPLDNPSLFAQVRAAWDIQMPTGCAACATSLSAVLDHYGTRLAPGRRFALLSYERDPTISGFLGVTEPMFQQLLGELATSRIDAIPTMKYFIIPGRGHVLFPNFGMTASDGTRLGDWLQQMVSDDPAWRSRRP